MAANRRVGGVRRAVPDSERALPFGSSFHGPGTTSRDIFFRGFGLTSISSIFAMVAIMLGTPVAAHEKGHAQQEQHGYVLKPGEGEVIDGRIIKASPESGTRGSVLIYDEMAGGSTSGVHYHLKADEIFYVLEGLGTVMLGDEDIAVEPGDTIFVPVGQDHKITSSKDRPLKVIFFLDKPGLEEQFRLNPDRETMTVEQFNAIVEKYGTIYKTFK